MVSYHTSHWLPVNNLYKSGPKYKNQVTDNAIVLKEMSPEHGPC